MAHNVEDVKRWARCVGWCRKHKESALNFIDRHARLGWYIAAVGTLDLLLQLLELFQ